MIPRKHAFEIMAWANGAEIEFNNGHGWFAARLDDFSHESWKFRIKPKPSVVRWKCAYQRSDGRWLETEHFYTQEEIAEAKGYTKLEYTRTEFPE